MARSLTAICELRSIRGAIRAHQYCLRCDHYGYWADLSVSSHGQALVNVAEQSLTMAQANENLPPAVISNLMRELQSLAKFAGVSGISVRLPDDRLTTIHAEIHGPEETPYFGGVFHCKLVLGADYPTQPPKAVFATKIFHPNVNSDGMICVSALKKDWQPTQGLRHTLAVIRCLLIQPNPESALNEEAGRMLLEDYDEYASRARLFTKIYAAPKPANDGSKVATAVILEPGLQKKQKRSIKRL